MVRTDGAEGLPIDPISFKVIEGGASEIAAGLCDFAEAGVDEFTLIIDPARPSTVETIARAAELARA